MFKKKKLAEAQKLLNTAIKDVTASNFDHAIECYNAALEIQEKVLGSASADTAETYNNLGLVHKFKGEYEQAFAWYQKALSAYEQSLGATHRKTQAVRNNIETIQQQNASETQ